MKKAKKKLTIRDWRVRDKMASRCLSLVMATGLDGYVARQKAQAAIVRTIENALRQQKRAALLTGMVAAIEHVNPRNARIAKAVEVLVPEIEKLMPDWRANITELGENGDPVGKAWVALLAELERKP